MFGLPAPAVVPSAEVLTASLTRVAMQRIEKWLLPIYGRTEAMELHVAGGSDGAGGSGTGGSSAGGGMGGAGGSGTGGSSGGGGGAAATPAQAAPGSAGPGPNTSAAANALAQMHGAGGEGSAAAAPEELATGRKRHKTVRFAAACRVCKRPVGPVHQCLNCGECVHAICGHTLAEGYGEPVICYVCLVPGATEADAKAMAEALAVALPEQPSGRAHLRRGAAK
jgi:hypothetical protein